MKPKIYPNCKIYYFDRTTYEWGIFKPEEVTVTLRDGFTFYEQKEGTKRKLLIAQALNIKKASAKMLTLISIEERTKKNEKK